MPLPKIDLPTYELTVPSSKQTVTVRPFTVKEEKLLMMAVESGKISDITSTVKQVINNCVLDGKIDVDKLPFYDIDYIFIFLRAKSIGEKQEIKLTCKNMVDDHECNNVFPAEIDMNNVEILGGDLQDKIALDDKKGVKMKCPNYSAVKSIDAAKNDIDKKTALIVASIDYIYDEKGTYSAKDHTTDDLTKFIEGLTEFIPVSSTGHLLLVGHFLGVHSPGRTFEVLIQLGAILAVILVYFRRLWDLALSVPYDSQEIGRAHV